MVKNDVIKKTEYDKLVAKVNGIDVIKKAEYDKLVAKVNGIDNTNFVSRTKYEKIGSDFEDKIDIIDKKNT